VEGGKAGFVFVGRGVLRDWGISGVFEEKEVNGILGLGRI